MNTLTVTSVPARVTVEAPRNGQTCRGSTRS